ncbi:hypothetical protein DPEC_G00047910 [Dallia pectoralis]|uniref:Uncharacterized protein n=1 Tax=Dallia pectoralis TaxID=75939 RepID=A0ACC2HB23_DALPE|nr:hypothetical protein DPEC_G00047910 [Dallia pectoralis]
MIHGSLVNTSLVTDWPVPGEGGGTVLYMEQGHPWKGRRGQLFLNDPAQGYGARTRVRVSNHGALGHPVPGNGCDELGEGEWHFSWSELQLPMPVNSQGQKSKMRLLVYIRLMRQANAPAPPANQGLTKIQLEKYLHHYRSAHYFLTNACREAVPWSWRKASSHSCDDQSSLRDISYVTWAYHNHLPDHHK